ncbi:hypothetical protein [Butyrivibrio sp. FCS014]|nr:hypothetical protein [Butyrivibrio sp. FCS014]
MSLDWNRNGHLDAADYMITEMLNKELEEKKKEGDEDETNCKREKNN